MEDLAAVLTLPVLRSVVEVSEGDAIAMQALEKAIRADERAKGAHERMDRFEETTAQAFRDATSAQAATALAVTDLRVDVGKINARVGMAAAVGSLIGGGAIAVLVGVIGHPATKSSVAALQALLSVF